MKKPAAKTKGKPKAASNGNGTAKGVAAVENESLIRDLHTAKATKKDEFYTQYADIEKEMNAYLDYDANVFKDKTILLPCDDPEWS